jgi:hypothetical protein
MPPPVRASSHAVDPSSSPAMSSQKHPGQSRRFTAISSLSHNQSSSQTGFNTVLPFYWDDYSRSCDDDCAIQGMMMTNTRMKK